MRRSWTVDESVILRDKFCNFAWFCEIKSTLIIPNCFCSNSNFPQCTPLKPYHVMLIVSGVAKLRQSAALNRYSVYRFVLFTLYLQWRLPSSFVHTQQRSIWTQLTTSRRLHIFWLHMTLDPTWTVEISSWIYTSWINTSWTVSSWTVTSRIISRWTDN